MQLVSSLTKDDIWGEWFDLKRFERYYRYLQKRIVRGTAILQILMASLALLAMAATLLSLAKFAWLPNWVFPTVQIITILLFFVSYHLDKILNFSIKLTVLNQAIIGCSDLETEIKELWRKVHTTEMSDDNASDSFRNLIRSRNRLLNIADQIFPENEKLNAISGEEATRELESYILNTT